MAKAGVWGSQPVVGLVGDYYTNPALVSLPNTAESHGDLLVDAPTSYVGDGYKLTVLPSVRVSTSSGYSYLDSNYQKLNFINEFDLERDTLTVATGASRESSLYHDFLIDGSTGVRKDSLLGEVTLDHRLSERLTASLDATWTRVLYGQAIGVGLLTDYKYWSVAPSLSWQSTERGKLTAQAGFGRYIAIDARTGSDNAYLQAGYDQQLSELWSLSAVAGYTRARNRADLTEDVLRYFPPFGFVLVPVSVTVRTTQNGSIYSLSLSRQATRFNLGLTASQQLKPTGFAFLSKQQSYQVKSSYAVSPLWTLSGDANRVNYQQPQGTLTPLQIQLTYLDLSAAWRSSEHWTVTLAATRVLERYRTSSIDLASTGVSVEFSRQFDWKTFQ